ncbi:MAG: hypothetical protein FJ042_09010, partial [Candidatus Cloacimonetes bacterium]|nr:hypothetical protein [Candidatus Cloacimonadota bacterium]
MKKALLFVWLAVISIVLMNATIIDVLSLSETDLTEEVIAQIAEANRDYRGPSFNFSSIPYNLPDATDIAGDNRFNEDSPWVKDFSRHINNPGGGPLYLYWSTPQHFVISRPDPDANPLQLRFVPQPQHWNGNELMILTISDEPLDRTDRAFFT